MHMLSVESNLPSLNFEGMVCLSNYRGFEVPKKVSKYGGSNKWKGTNGVPPPNV